MWGASWHGFATAIIEGLAARGVQLAVDRIVPVATQELLTAASRPANSRLNLKTLKTVFGISPPDWRVALQPELDQLRPRDDGSRGEPTRLGVWIDLLQVRRDLALRERAHANASRPESSPCTECFQASKSPREVRRRQLVGMLCR